jgi:hypothetical protein
MAAMDDEGLKLQGTSPIFDSPEHWLRRQALRSALSTVCNSKRLASYAGDPAGSCGSLRPSMVSTSVTARMVPHARSAGDQLFWRLHAASIYSTLITPR